MSDFILVDKQDTRYSTLQKGFNLRWPTSGNGADYIYVCHSTQDVIDAANDALLKGNRITVRSGGHCYEGFVANKLSGEGEQPLAIVDISLMTGMIYREEGDVVSPYDQSATYKFSLSSGNQNWDGYVNLYKGANRTIPGGSCYSVGAGGHITGGGYGLLSRMHGLTVDWLSGVDILIPNTCGNGMVAKHVNLSSEGNDRDLFIACRGGGGGNFGIVLNYYFADLPVAPQKAYLLTLSYPWSDFISQDQFDNFMRAYWQWFADNDADWNSADLAKANGGLFALLKVQHRSTGDINLVVQYTGINGTVGGIQDQPFVDFVNTMNAAAGFTPQVRHEIRLHGALRGDAEMSASKGHPVKDARLMDWLYLTQTINGSGDNQRGKYKSCYQKAQFGQRELDTLWNYLNITGRPEMNQMLVQFDSYGGCVNVNDEINNPTSVFQRSSLLKAQFQIYWKDYNDDEMFIGWMQGFYAAYFAEFGGKPMLGDNYEGCYINYPDIDMKYTDESRYTVDKNWLRLYYGDKSTQLIATKNNVDPHNIFRNELSIPLIKP
ncbi:MAG: BBE domain-containing protein [Ewingella sp.]|uniref:BBE domain-containing protein n=1 Tax=Ewingella sp. TaxID=1897459 RepID=UPI003F93749A